jgi:hypothetical protein
MSFPLSHIRADLLRRLGFDGFFEHPLHEWKTWIAFMIPKSFYENLKHYDTIGYIYTVIKEYGWKSQSISWHPYNSYILPETSASYRLGPHVLFELEFDISIPHMDVTEPLPPKPEIPAQWSVVTVGNMSEAAFPEDYVATFKRLTSYTTHTHPYPALSP